MYSHMQVFNLSNPQTVYKELDSPLKFQTRCITCFPDSTGYLVSSTTPCSSVHQYRLLSLSPGLPCLVGSPAGVGDCRAFSRVV